MFFLIGFPSEIFLKKIGQMDRGKKFVFALEKIIPLFS